MTEIHQRAKSILSLEPGSSQLKYIEQTKRDYKGVNQPYPDVPFCERGTAFRFIKPTSKNSWELHIGTRRLSPNQSDPTIDEAKRLQKKFDPTNEGRVCMFRVSGRPIDRYGLFFQPPPMMTTSIDEQLKASQELMDNAVIMNEMEDAEYKRAELMAFDWAISKTIAEPVLKEIELVMPNLNLDGGMRPHLLKMIQLGFEAGMESDELIDISTRLRSIQALRAIIFLRFARRLHRENIRNEGPGISHDFEDFVKKTEHSILNRKLRFRDISGPIFALYYHTQANTLILSPIKPERSLLRRFSSVLHELYHSYEDRQQMNNSFWKNEKMAMARQIKALILLFNWLEKGSGVQWAERIERLIHRRKSTHANVEERLGFHPDVVKLKRTMAKADGHPYGNPS
jgi:hypothetical protein